MQQWYALYVSLYSYIFAHSLLVHLEGTLIVTRMSHRYIIHWKSKSSPVCHKLSFRDVKMECYNASIQTISVGIDLFLYFTFPSKINRSQSSSLDMFVTINWGITDLGILAMRYLARGPWEKVPLYEAPRLISQWALGISLFIIMICCLQRSCHDIPRTNCSMQINNMNTWWRLPPTSNTYKCLYNSFDFLQLLTRPRRSLSFLL